MPLNLYKQIFESYFNSEDFQSSFEQAEHVLKQTKRIFFIGNGGSNAISSHMYEDFAKICGYQTFAFSDAALITCYANDYGYENAMAEWLKVYVQPGDVLIAISSSGNSPNILNAAATALAHGANLITLSGFKPDNRLKGIEGVHFYIPIENYGIVESYHQVVLHVLLDKLAIK